MSKTDDPRCAYCGKPYDFARRPASFENCCPACLPPQPKVKLQVIIESRNPADAAARLEAALTNARVQVVERRHPLRFIRRTLARPGPDSEDFAAFFLGAIIGVAGFSDVLYATIFAGAIFAAAWSVKALARWRTHRAESSTPEAP